MKHNELLLLLCKKTTNLQCLCEAQKVRGVIELFLLFCFVNWTLIGKTQLESRKSLYILKRRNIKAEFTKNKNAFQSDRWLYPIVSDGGSAQSPSAEPPEAEPPRYRPPKRQTHPLDTDLPPSDTDFPLNANPTPCAQNDGHG